MTEEQHNILVQLCQQGIERLTEQARAALGACAPIAATAVEAVANEAPDDKEE